MTDDLKPCPFCGGEAMFVHMHGSADNMWGFVKCAKKTKHCCEQPRIRPKDLAIADWNRRKSI